MCSKPCLRRGGSWSIEAKRGHPIGPLVPLGAKPQPFPRRHWSGAVCGRGFDTTWRRITLCRSRLKFCRLYGERCVREGRGALERERDRLRAAVVRTRSNVDLECATNSYIVCYTNKFCYHWNAKVNKALEAA